MAQVYIRSELYKKIVKTGKEVQDFVNEAVDEKLKREEAGT